MMRESFSFHFHHAGGELLITNCAPLPRHRSPPTGIVHGMVQLGSQLDAVVRQSQEHLEHATKQVSTVLALFSEILQFVNVFKQIFLGLMDPAPSI